MTLDFSPLQNALAQLAESLEYLNSDFAQDLQLCKQFRYATIHAFSCSYELSCKSLRRFLQSSTDSADIITAMTFPELIRTGYEKGLLQNSWSAWRLYRDARNSTSHAYAENIADEVLTKIPGFLAEAQYLHARLTEKSSA